MKNNIPFLAILFLFHFQLLYSQTWSPMGSGLEYGVNTIVYFNGNIYAGSDLVYQWNGNSWTAVTNGMNGLFGATDIEAMAVNNNTLFIGGTFFVLTPDQDWYNYAAKLYNGSWTTCGSGLGNDGSGMDDIPLAMISYGGELYTGGMFQFAGGDPLNQQIAMYIARFDGSYWNPVGGGLNEHITDMTIYNNQLIVSGYFTEAGNTEANYIATWDGGSWHALGSGMARPYLCKVTALAVHNGDLYAGGLFDSAGGKPATNIAKWDGTSWSAVGDGINGQVYSLASYNGNLYASGYFFISAGGPGNYITKWDGSQWSNVGSGTDAPINSFLVQDNKLYAGGSFTIAGGQPAEHIAVLSDNAASVKNNDKLSPDEFSLCQNYPNPFNPTTNIEFQIAKSGFVSLKIYNTLGKEVATLVNEERPAGIYDIKFDASKLTSGIYFYKLQNDNHSQVKKMVILK
ncbi:MAG: T9SS type A sorting domain-containing protein [Ignavibacteriaceae bacterium]